MPRALLLLLLLNACTQPLPEMTATVAEGCGNGRVEGEEECDDGNINDRDACTNGCKHAICGDQILRADLGAGAEGYERCDDGDFDEIFCTRYCSPPVVGTESSSGPICDDETTRGGLVPNNCLSPAVVTASAAKRRLCGLR